MFNTVKITVHAKKFELNDHAYNGKEYTFLRYYDSEVGFISTHHVSEELKTYIDEYSSVDSDTFDIIISFAWNKFKKSYVITDIVPCD